MYKYLFVYIKFLKFPTAYANKLYSDSLQKIGHSFKCIVLNIVWIMEESGNNADTILLILRNISVLLKTECTGQNNFFVYQCL